MAKKARCFVTSATSPGAPGTPSILIQPNTKFWMTTRPQNSGAVTTVAAGNRKCKLRGEVAKRLRSRRVAPLRLWVFALFPCFRASFHLDTLYAANTICDAQLV